MRKTATLVCIILSLFIILGQFNAWDSLLLLLLVGSIPGTSMSIPPIVMLVIIAAFAGVGTFMITSSQGDISTTSSKKTLPKKRYSRI